MNFDLDIGVKSAATIQAQHAEMGYPVPGRARNVPGIEPSFQLWWTAWQDLTTDRPPGGLYPIPYSAIARYADRYRLDLGLLKNIIWKLDQLFLDRKQASKKLR